MQRTWGITAAAFGAAAVVLGAFGAHALRAHLDEPALAIWHTAVEYQFWHALALLAVAGNANSSARTWQYSGVSFAIGIVLFSGSLYALALGAPHGIGLITPCGGAALILGWIFLGVACCVATKE
jgi:uncharacterized membrane protein YgdD (TMEM256/DUF423 family)